MRYYFDTNTLFIRGNFRAASTGIAGGIRSVSTLINHTVPAGWSHEDPEKELEFVAAESGIDRGFFWASHCSACSAMLHTPVQIT